MALLPSRLPGPLACQTWPRLPSAQHSFSGLATIPLWPALPCCSLTSSQHVSEGWSPNGNMGQVPHALVTAYCAEAKPVQLTVAWPLWSPSCLIPRQDPPSSPHSRQERCLQFFRQVTVSPLLLWMLLSLNSCGSEAVPVLAPSRPCAGAPCDAASTIIP